ncbi:MAG: hypothetical protein M3O76_01195 [Actinomycetota bacterium]|nr:hypothetical protein [Actinomycetota bacterium]MDP9308300.1 hypothetical protein [Actinomycetota bacterium]
MTLIAGLILVAVGALLAWRLRHRLEPKTPASIAKLDRMQPGPTYLIAVAVGARSSARTRGTAEAVVGVLVFLVVGMSTAYMPVLLAQFLPDR